MDEKGELFVTVLNQKDKSLLPILSSLSSETSNTILLDNIRTCLGYIISFTIEEVDEKLFQWIIPPIKTALQKTFDENFLMSDTCDDEYIVHMLKDNLKFVFNLLEIVGDVLKFLVENSTVNICYIKSVAVASVEIMSSTFNHCKKSPEQYKKNFNQDLLDIFKLTQEHHILFFHLFESSILVDNDGVDILLDVLDNLCVTSEIVHSLNIKLLTTNYKGYLTIIQKFVGVLSNKINLKKPIVGLSAVIYDNFCTNIGLDSSSLSESYSTSIKYSGFLIKVVLKILDIFWNHKKDVLDEIIHFCCIIYSFSARKYVMMDCPPDIVALVDETVFHPMRSFVLRCLQDELFIQAVIHNRSLLTEKYCYGLLSLLNEFFEFMVIYKNVPDSELPVLLKMVFDASKLCFKEFFWPDSIFNDLVINITGTIMVNDKYYEKIEPILMENLLQEDVWNYFLAAEVWCLLLRNASPQLCVDTLSNILKIYTQLEFGYNTHRLEKIYLIHFMQRLYSLIPDYLKCQMGQSIFVTKNAWKKMDFQHIPKEIKVFVDEVYKVTLEKIDELGTDRFSCQDLFLVGENLEMLSTVNFRVMCMESSNLVNALEGIWEYTFADTNNNIFKYFIIKLFKITSSLAKELNNKQLYTVLNQLTRLSSQNSFKIQTTMLLSSICLINPIQFGQDACKIFTIISNIIITVLRDSNNIIKQSILELLEICAQSGKQIVVRDVVIGCNEMQTLIFDYLQKRIMKSKFDAEYFKEIGSLEYKHNCIEWKYVNPSKRFKLDDFENTNNMFVKQNVLRESRSEDNVVRDDDFNTKKSNTHIQHQETSLKDGNKSKETLKYKLKEFRYKSYKKIDKPTEDTTESKVEENDSVNEVLVRLKGEIKCLINVLKTEKLTQKNISDLKILTNQLSSLM